ncbi:hypothetical protein [Neobacillus terrae]|nr:hypothetical protein [Neobacillus terrae]
MTVKVFNQKAGQSIAQRVFIFNKLPEYLPFLKTLGDTGCS